MTTHTHQLIQALRAALSEQFPAQTAWTQAHLEPLKAKGLAHDHIRLAGTGLLARIPKQSQMQLPALANLRYQQTCFERASAAGFAPRCLCIITPCTSLPRGALMVQEIVGRAAQLPQDLPLIAASMAALHRINLPPEASRAPLLNAPDPLQAMWDEVSAQAAFLPQADLAPSVASAIQTELARFQALCLGSARPLRRLIAFDGHPGNFVIAKEEAAERAYLVDLEKCRYSYPSFDLAHATLYTSTTWDVDSHTVLTLGDVEAMYRTWEPQVDATLSQDAKHWHLPLRRAMWLWSITWCAKWRVASQAGKSASQDGEDWSAQNVESTLAAHVRERVDHYLSESGVNWVLAEFEALEKHLHRS
ncbi:MAG: phosphotransferase [Brachymonas sp.]|nr:phosphotransferase [Brachymonas sp.]